MTNIERNFVIEFLITDYKFNLVKEETIKSKVQSFYPQDDNPYEITRSNSFKDNMRFEFQTLEDNPLQDFINKTDN